MTIREYIIGCGNMFSMETYNDAVVSRIKLSPLPYHGIDKSYVFLRAHINIFPIRSSVWNVASI